MKKVIVPERIGLKNHPEINEKVIQQTIADDPSILGLGDLVLKDKERRQPKAGRLDLLLQEPESGKRYEVEIQLGKTDESHIIRTVEYWDIEKKRYPQFDHCAVIVAEDITSRFLNVLSLFNGAIPIIAIQMSAHKCGDEVGLVFTRVLDERTLGLPEEEESEFKQMPASKEYWLKKASADTLRIVEDFAVLIHEESSAEMKMEYSKMSIQLTADDLPIPYMLFRPRKKNHVVLVLKMSRNAEADKIIENNDFDAMDYDARRARYRIRINGEDIRERRNALLELIYLARNSYEN